MNKTTIKIFLSFSFVAAVIATLLLIINALESLLLTQIFCYRSILPNPFWKTLLGI